MPTRYMQGLAPGRMKGLLLSYGSDLYLYGGMPHTAFTSANRNLNTTSFAYPDGQTIFMRLNSSSGNWESVSCEGAVPESKTRIHAGHAGECFQHDFMVPTGKRARGASAGNTCLAPSHVPCLCSSAHFWPSHGIEAKRMHYKSCPANWQSCSHQAGRRHAARPLYCFVAVSVSA